ncbi:MAG: HlyD family secretion protein [Flavobacteriaceae bacterium]
MLNISKNNLLDRINLSSYKSGKFVLHKNYYKILNRFLIAFGVILLVMLFLPWTQNVTSYGTVTTLTPNFRPQMVVSPLAGQIKQWFVTEGTYVKKGDTLLVLSEVKGAYLDRSLIERTQEQLTAKEQALESYQGKVLALDRQIQGLKQEQVIKLKQAENKIIQSRLKKENDSITLLAAITAGEIARTQFQRTEKLYESGLKSKVDLENKRLKFREVEAKLKAQENKFLVSQAEWYNAQSDVSRLQAYYLDKISKAESDQFSAQSMINDAQGSVSKLKSSLSNYNERKDLLHIQAPRDGFINKALKSGIGETVKEGEALISIMPEGYELAVETYVRPIDAPLIHAGERVRVQFDGWPAIVFSGWESLSYGTYAARVVAIENFISPNGKYRVLLRAEPGDHPWPQGLRVGSGAKSIALLNDVPVWFELWRNLNGFPPNYYKPETVSNEKVY